MANYKPAPQGRSNSAVSGTLNPGEYPAQIIQVQVKFSKCGNYEQHALRVRVEDTANDHWEDFWERLTFSDTAMWKVEQVLDAVGLNSGKECDVLPEHWLDKRCRVEVGERDGKLQIKRWKRKAAAPVAKKMPDALTRLKAGRGAVGEDGLPF